MKSGYRAGVDSPRRGPVGELEVAVALGELAVVHLVHAVELGSHELSSQCEGNQGWSGGETHDWSWEEGRAGGLG